MTTHTITLTADELDTVRDALQALRHDVLEDIRYRTRESPLDFGGPKDAADALADAERDAVKAHALLDKLPDDDEDFDL
jgi:hypothetical protein